MKKIIVLSLFMIGCLALQAETHSFNNFSYVASCADSSFQDYVGVYKLEENPLSETYTITFENGKLYGQAIGYDKTELTKQTEPNAFKSGYGSDVVFIQEEVGKPFNKVKLVVQGNAVIGTKQWELSIVWLKYWGGVLCFSAEKINNVARF